jgi:hypothetical protein
MVRPPIRLAVAATAVVMLSACGSDPQRDHADARAKLDRESSQIVLPLEAYAMTASEVKDVSHANAILVDECLSKSGRTFPRATQNWDAIQAIPDRRYGLWSVQDAESNGYELPESSEAKALAAQEDSLGDEWWKAFQSCRAEVRLFPVKGINSSPEMSPVDKGMKESFDAVLASELFANTLKAWSGCIESEGLTPNTDEKFMVPKFPPAGEEQLRVAAVDVRCKETKNSVQPLADFEARQQMSYIDKHESELKGYRTQVDETLTAARKVLSNGGG